MEQNLCAYMGVNLLVTPTATSLSLPSPHRNDEFSKLPCGGVKAPISLSFSETPNFFFLFGSAAEIVGLFLEMCWIFYMSFFFVCDVNTKNKKFLMLSVKKTQNHNLKIPKNILHLFFLLAILQTYVVGQRSTVAKGKLLAMAALTSTRCDVERHYRSSLSHVKSPVRGSDRGQCQERGWMYKWEG